MKITIPSRIGIPIAPPSAAPPPAQVQASSSSSSRPTIKIKQSQQPSASIAGTSAGYPSPQLPEQAQGYGQGQGIAPGNVVKTEDHGQQGEAAAGLGVPAKRKRNSVTPSGSNNAAGGSNATASSQVVIPTEKLMQLFNHLRDVRKDGRIISTEFMHLPPRYDFPDYYATIKKPISFAEVKIRLDRKTYTTLKQLADDFHQMFVNAKRYNQKGSNIFEDAKRLDKHMKTMYTKLSGGASFDGFGGSAPDGVAAAGAAAGSEDDGLAVPTPSTSGLPISATYPAGTSQQAPEQVQKDGKKPKRKHRKGAGSAAAQAAAAAREDDKPMTLTRWLTAKVDDLMAVTDEYGRTLADIFVILPPQDQYPDYYQLIQRPVSFQLVRSRLKNRNYPTIQKFIDDVNAIFTNAQYYNEEGSQVWQDAKVLQNHFAELMKEPAPEFHVRPRNKDQQAVTNPADANSVRLSIGGTAANAADSSQITLQMGQNGGIENIAFAEEWDDDGAMVEDEQLAEEEELQQAEEADQRMDIDAKKEESRSPVHQPHAEPPTAAKVGTSPIPPSAVVTSPALPAQLSLPSPAISASAGPGLALPTVGLPNRQPSQQPPLSAVSPSAPSPGLQPPARPSASSGVAYPSKSSAAPSKTRTLSRIAVGQSPFVRSFIVTFVSSTSATPSGANTRQELLLSNAIVRQHSLVCPREVDRIDIIPVLGPAAMDIPKNAPNLSIAMRPQHTVADAPVGLEDGQQGYGAGLLAKTKWLTRPMSGLNVIEISTLDGKETYRIFVNKNAA